MLISSAVRPINFEEFVGQKQLVNSIKIMINSAKERGAILDSILFFGPPGLGKTTLANIIASVMGGRLHYVQGVLIQKQADILSLLSSIREGDLIFIDEIHSMNKSVEEMIYSAIEDFVIDIPIGVEGERRIMRMKLPPFTLIGATTKINQVSSPLRDRFGLVAKLNLYNFKEIKQIVKRNAVNLGIKVNEEALNLLAYNSKFVPRICINLLKRSNDFAIYEEKDIVDLNTVKLTLRNLGISHLGLNSLQIDYLKCLNDIFERKWASLDAISSIISEEKTLIVSNIESDLLLFHLIEKSSKGRRITKRGINYLSVYVLQKKRNSQN